MVLYYIKDNNNNNKAGGYVDKMALLGTESHLNPAILGGELEDKSADNQGKTGVIHCRNIILGIIQCFTHIIPRLIPGLSTTFPLVIHIL